MTQRAIRPADKNKCGDQGREKLSAFSQVGVTEFEAKVRDLDLVEAEYVSSRELKLWCQRNRNRVYIPEWLLGEWGMDVQAIFTGIV